MTEKNFSAERIDELIRSAVGDCDLTSREIPNIDLYVDQILTLVSDKNAESSQRYHENHLTKTMINNYSKEGLISSIKGKKYTKEHIVQILLIYALKNSLSIGEINRLIQGVYREGFDSKMLTDCYDRFIEMKDVERQRARECATSLVADAGLDLDDREDFCVALLSIVSLSSYLKAIAEEMLCARYPVPVDPKEEEKAKAKAKNEEEKKEKEKAKSKSKDAR